MVELKLSIKGF